MLRMWYHPAAHSDDELVIGADNVKRYHIRTIPSRNPDATTYVRRVDRDQSAKRSNTQTFGRSKHERVVPANPIDSRFTSLLESTSVDWFTPEAYAQLTMELQLKYGKNGFVLPPTAVLQNESDSDWKTLTPSQFMARYGTELRTKWPVPTEEQREQYEERLERDSQGDSAEDEDEEQVRSQTQQ